jgi:hypothetical protein
VPRLDEGEVMASLRTHASQGHAMRVASRAMRGSEGGGACCDAGEGGRQVLEAVVPADLLDEIDVAACPRASRGRVTCHATRPSPRAAPKPSA